MLDTVSQNRLVERRRLGRGPLWKIRLALPKTRVLFRRPPSAGEDAGRPGWCPRRI